MNVNVTHGSCSEIVKLEDLILALRDSELGYSIKKISNHTLQLTIIDIEQQSDINLELSVSDI